MSAIHFDGAGGRRVQIAELKFGDVGRGMSRYRPVALAVVAIVVMGLTLPGPRRVTGKAFDIGSFDTPASTGLPVSAEVPEAAATEEVAAAVTAIDTSPSSFSSSFSTFSSPASSSTGSSSSAASSSFTVDSGASRSEADERPSSSTFDSSSPPASESPAAVTPTPLRVETAAWASAQAGTPVASTGVPEGSLPVGRRPGFETDKVSFVRLAGTATTLTLVPHGDAAGQRNAGSAQIQACRITTAGWTKKEAQSMGEAPKWDCAVAAVGQRAADGSWTFDLSGFPERSGSSGFALVPAGAGLDYQVAFKVT